MNYSFNLLAASAGRGIDFWLPVVGIVVASVLAVIILIGLTLSLTVNGILFSRQDKNPDFKYFTPEEFGVERVGLAVNYRGKSLSAALYFTKPLEECEGVIIFSHGFGAGTSSYMTEIAYFARLGFAVAAADAYGCNNSEGKSVLGFYAGAEAVIATYISVCADQRLKDKKITLLGHSWGAYSVLCASEKVSADKVVALSAFNAPAQCVSDNLKSLGGLARLQAPLLQPFFHLINFLKFGTKGNRHADKAIKKSNVKTLLIHGEMDKTVPLKHSAAAKAKGENVTVLKLADKKHNPYNTVKAEEKLTELMHGRSFESAEERKEYIASFDWKAATEEDGEVMDKIVEFIRA